MPTLVCYISGHGFGHAVRVMEVLRALSVRRPDIDVMLRTPAPRGLFELGLPGRFAHAACRLDVGVLQRDSLSVDVGGTLRAYTDMIQQKAALIAAEVTAIAPLRPALIFADIPALAFDIAARLAVPGVGMTNFSWDWIYVDYIRDFPGFSGVVEDLRGSYAQAALLLRLPLHGDLTAFPRIRDIPLVARKAKISRYDVRRRLRLPEDERVVLLSFGGIGLRLPMTASLPRVTFVAGESAAESAGVPGCRAISNAQMAAVGVGYEDLVAASDAVMTKPGYGIVSDCIANGTPIIYTSRGRFAEYACLVEGITAHLPHAFISNEDLLAGHWAAALEAVLAQPRRQPSIDTNGAAVAAEALASYL